MHNRGSSSLKYHLKYFPIYVRHVMQGKADATFDHGYKDDIPFIWYGGKGRVLIENENRGGHQGNHYEPRVEDTVYLQSAIIVGLGRKS